MAALPQAIQSAKELYDLRSRYKDASVLITAIYSESMVIAASLSQVQNLLHHDALQSKPQLLETFDRALTGCRVVYGCLEQEVRDLVVKAEADELKFKDRAKFLWKEDTFKELLTQIRGQQSALSLLIQGLQMESIADIRKLVAENSVTLDQVVKRSRTLRQSHPRVQVPESLFSHTQEREDAVDAESIVKSTAFTFDDEVINSTAYRRAMRLYTSKNEPRPDKSSTLDADSDHPPAYEHGSGKDDDQDEKLTPSLGTPAVSTPSDDKNSAVENADVETQTPDDDSSIQHHQDAFDSIEREYLPYMPRITSTAPHLSPLRANTSNAMAAPPTNTTSRNQFRSFSEGNHRPVEEAAPPLPPRRPSGPQLRADAPTPDTPKARSASSDDSTIVSTAPSILSNTSTTSSHTTYEPSDQGFVVSRKPMRKPLPLAHRVSNNVSSAVRTQSSIVESPSSTSPLHNVDMHEVWLSIIDAEQKFIERMSKFRKMFYDNVLRQWPQLEKHLQVILIGEQLAALNKDSLLQIMEQQVAGSEDSICDSTVFEQWTNEVHKLYREYCQGMPHTASSLRTTQNMDPKFGPFVNTVGLSLAWFGMGWEDYLKQPVAQLELYAAKLQDLVRIAEELDDPTAFHEVTRLNGAAAAVEWLKATTSTVLRNAEGREETQNLEKRIHTLDATMFSQLRLLDSGRRVRHQGSMAIKLKGQGPWQAVHVILLDNFLLWGKVKPQKKSKGDKIVVLDAPIAVDDLGVFTPCDDHQFQKATLFDDIPRGTVVYIITIKSISGKKAPHMLGAFGVQERKVWLEHFTAATNPQQART
jgi:hypothetical protein